jgi:hypothetical protein
MLYLQILVKSILKNRSFKNPFTALRDRQAREEFKQYGRSYSAPESYDVLYKRYIINSSHQPTHLSHRPINLSHQTINLSHHPINVFWLYHGVHFWATATTTRVKLVVQTTTIWVQPLTKVWRVSCEMLLFQA